MPEQWVLNASPLIVLARVGLEHLLWELPDKVVVPHTVIAEIEAGPTDDPARRVMAERRFLAVHVAPLPQILAWDLGAGETEVLSYPLRHPDWTAILDDAAARRSSFGTKLCKGPSSGVWRSSAKRPNASRRMCAASIPKWSGGQWLGCGIG